MKFIVDAQLPRVLANFLKQKGFDVIHTLDLPKKNATPDFEIIRLADAENRIVITKDYDFYESKLLRNKPLKLIFILTGNITNPELIQLIDENFEKLIELASKFEIIELDRDSIKAR